MTIYKDEPTLDNYDDDAWIDPNAQNYYLAIGERGFGKGVFDEFVANELYNNYSKIIEFVKLDDDDDDYHRPSHTTTKKLIR